MKKVLFTAVFFAATLISCESATYDEISSEEIMTGPVKYEGQVQNIMAAKCTSCHSQTGSASFLPLTTYEQVKPEIDNILNRIQRPYGDPLRMPQGGSMSSTDIGIILKWKQDGLLQK